MRTHAHTLHAIGLIIAILIPCLLMISPAALPARAAKTITETVDIATIREAAKGEGYVWSNRHKTMTFTDLNLITEDDYGFRFPSNATLILNGNNVISAKLVALAGQDTLKIKGNGTLTLIAETGLKMVSPELTSSLTIMDGKVIINATTCGIKSDFPTVIVGETNLEINLSDRENGRAIDAYSVMLNAGKLSTNAPIVSANNLTCGACDLTVNAASPALVAKQITMSEGNRIHVGSSENSLSDATVYDGENCIKLDPTKSVKYSILLGEGFPVFWDYLLMILALILLAASIVLPILLKIRKDRIKRAQVEARRAADAAARKEAAKAARRAKYTGTKQN